MRWLTVRPSSFEHAAGMWLVSRYVDGDAEFIEVEPGGRATADAPADGVLGPRTRLGSLVRRHAIERDDLIETLCGDVKLADAEIGQGELNWAPALEPLRLHLLSGDALDPALILDAIDRHLRARGFCSPGDLSPGLFKTVLRRMPVGVMVLDRGGRTIYANERMGRIVGRDPGSMRGLEITEFDLDCVDRQGRHVMEVQKVLAVAQSRRRAVGKVITATGSGTARPTFLATSFEPLDDETGGPPRVLVTCVDVTEDVLVHEALRDGEAHKQFILNTLPYGVMEFDAEGTITYSNRALDAMFGYRAGELLGEPAWFCKTGDVDAESIRGEYARLLTERWAPQHYMATVKTRNGRAFQARVDWDFRRDDDSLPTGFIATLTDVSEDFMRQSEMIRQLNRVRREL